MLGRLKDKLTGASKRLSGKTDLLEGIAAACVLVAAADGTIDDGEVDTMLKALC
ncbi:MAG TPA: TerB, partial [Gammaproteobacteria bacterium]|nr:TerB [Gammaproteobacteria bacterium]